MRRRNCPARCRSCRRPGPARPWRRARGRPAIAAPGAGASGVSRRPTAAAGGGGRRRGAGAAGPAATPRTRAAASSVRVRASSWSTPVGVSRCSRWLHPADQRAHRRIARTEGSSPGSVPRRRGGGAPPGASPAAREHPAATRPVSYAQITAWTRSRSPSLVSTLLTWVFTVCSLTTSAAAISALDRPRASSSSVSRSRAVSTSSRGRAGGAAGPRRRRGVLRDQPPGHRRREQRVARRDHPYGVHQVVPAHVLEQEPARPRVQRVVHVVVRVERGQHDRPAARSPRRSSGRPRCRPYRHPDVEQHHVGRVPPDRLDRLPRRRPPRRPPRCPAGRPGSSRTRCAPAPGRRRPPPGSSPPHLRRGAGHAGAAPAPRTPGRPGPARPRRCRRRPRPAPGCRSGRARRTPVRPAPRPSSVTVIVKVSSV